MFLFDNSAQNEVNEVRLYIESCVFICFKYKLSGCGLHYTNIKALFEIRILSEFWASLHKIKALS